jgi:hypothetical protein
MSIIRTSIISLLIGISPPTLGKSFAIFVPVIEETKEVEKAFKADATLSETNVMAFSKFRDFSGMKKLSNFEYALLPSTYLDYYDDYTPIYQVTKGNKSSFEYLIVSLERKWNLDNLKNGVIGLVDIVGRLNTKPFLSKLLNNKAFRRIRRVSKARDLYPMLALGNVNYILVSPYNFARIQKNTQAKHFMVLKSIKVKYPMIFVRKGSKATQSKNFKNIDSSTLKVLGFDSIVAIAGDE